MHAGLYWVNQESVNFDFYPVSRSKKQVLKTGAFMQGHNIVFVSGEAVNSPWDAQVSR